MGTARQGGGGLREARPDAPIATPYVIASSHSHRAAPPPPPVAENANSEVAARIVKARLEKTSLGDVASHIRELYASHSAVLEVKLDLAAIARLQLTDVSAASVANSIRKAPKLRLKAELVKVTSACWGVLGRGRVAADGSTFTDCERRRLQ